ncbi:MAG: DUF2058 family protein [bacterium]|nr:DUF2058 family protein [bacterium]
MQNLRDQLLKTGVINKKQQRQAEQAKRHERKQHRKGQFDEIAQAQQQQAYADKLEAERAASRDRAAAQHAQQEAKERRLQIRHIIDYWQMSEDPTGDQRWYFTTLQNTIKHLSVSDPLASQLTAGNLAIVARPDDTDTLYVLVDREAAALIVRIDPQYVRFHNREPADMPTVENETT